MQIVYGITVDFLFHDVIYSRKAFTDFTFLEVAILKIKYSTQQVTKAGFPLFLGGRRCYLPFCNLKPLRTQVLC